MDREGYLPLTLIASFARVRALTTELEVIVEAIYESGILELKPIDDGYMVS